MDQVKQIRSESSCQKIQKEIMHFKYFTVFKNIPAGDPQKMLLY